MTFLDTSALVGVLMQEHPQHSACKAALEGANRPCSNAHALAETFATLTGFYKVPVEVAAELALGLKEVIEIDTLSQNDYETAISEARQRGIMGGGIYDSLHATFARRKGAKQIVTRNSSHFSHAAPELEIIVP